MSMPSQNNNNSKNDFVNVLWRSFKMFVSGNLFTEQGIFYPSEHVFRRLSAFVLAFVQAGLLTLAAFLNFFEGCRELIPPLALAGVPSLVALIWLYCNKQACVGPLYFLAGSLIALGIYLLLVKGASDHSSLVWFIVFPPMVMFSMGLTHGSLVCGAFFLFLLLLFLTPLEQCLTVPIPKASSYRMLAAMFGAFVFAFCAEHVRYNIHRSLEMTLKRLEHESRCDLLTGLGNRRDFQDFYARVLARASRNDESYCLAIIDLDSFKAVNDTYGHDVGDLVLEHISHILKANIRLVDGLFRWGGEEFLLLMPDTPCQDGLMALERLRSLVETTPFIHNVQPIRCTISIGMYCGEEHQDKNIPIREADQRLYEAKRTGRNKVVN